jgi:hypothetical protein
MQKILTFVPLISLFLQLLVPTYHINQPNVCKIPPPNLHMITSSRKKVRITHQPSHKLNGENLLGKKNHLRDKNQVLCGAQVCGTAGVSIKPGR